MNKLPFLILSFVLFFGTTQIIIAQTAAAKYNNAGDLIWASKLLPDATGCEAAKVFTGKIVAIESAESNNAVGYEFSLRPAAGKTQKMQVSVSLDDGAFVVDFENLMQKNRRIKTKVHQCGSGGFWTVEEIWRL